MTDNIVSDTSPVNLTDEAAIIQRETTAADADPILNEHAAEIHRVGQCARQRAVDDIAEIGRHLAEAEEHVGHGNRGAYLAWIQTEFGWSDQTARRFIHIYNLGRDPEFNKLLNLDLPISSLYKLAAPNTPQEARKEIVERVDAGEKPSVVEVQRTISRAKNPTRGQTASANLQKLSNTAIDDQNVVILPDWKTSEEYLELVQSADDGHVTDNAPGVSATKTPKATPKNKISLLTAWEATPEERQIISDLVLAEFFAQASGSDIFDRIAAARRTEVHAAFLDQLTVQGMLDAMSDEFGRELRARVPAPNVKPGKSDKPKFKTIQTARTTDASGKTVFAPAQRDDRFRH